MVWLTVALTTVGVGATALSATRIRTYSSQCRLIALFPAASTAARQLDLGSQGRPFVGDYRRFDRAHPFWVMLPWPPHGTMTATRPTANASAEAKGDTSWLGPRRRRWTSFAG
jgi:hypothetical protein